MPGPYIYYSKTGIQRVPCRGAPSYAASRPKSASAATKGSYIEARWAGTLFQEEVRRRKSYSRQLSRIDMAVSPWSDDQVPPVNELVRNYHRILRCFHTCHSISSQAKTAVVQALEHSVLPPNMNY